MSGAGGGRYNSPIDFRISQTEPPGLTGANSEQQVAFAISDLYNFSSQVIRTFIDYCGIGPQLSADWSLFAGKSQTLLSGNLNRLYVTASEDIVFGEAISLFDNAGILNVRLANATDNTKPADGFCSSPSGIAIATVGEVILSKGRAFVAGVALGTRYFLSTTPGNYSTAPAVGAGNIEQYLGIGIEDNYLFFNSHYWIQH